MTGSETDVDVEAVATYLGDRLDVAVEDVEVLHDGLNLSLAIRTDRDGPAAADGSTAADTPGQYDYVLRRPNKLRDTESFNDVRTEYEVLAGLSDTAIPAPEPVCLCADESVLGDPFLVTSFLPGEPVHLGSVLPARWQTPRAREPFATVVVDALADIHTVGVAGFGDACSVRTPRDQVAYLTDRLAAATSVTGHDHPSLWTLADWLADNVPPAGPTRLVHGDYRPANVLFAGDEVPAVTGVLDWEVAFLGDPLTELGYLLLRWREKGDPTPSLAGIRDRHGDSETVAELERTNECGLAPFTNEPGSPSRRELIARYEERTGLAYEHDRFYRGLAAFVLATVWAELHRERVEAGGDSNRPPWIEYVASLGASIVDGEFGC